MGDDAIGCICAREIGVEIQQREIDDVEVDQFYRGGISLMERLIGYDRVLIIDSITGYDEKPGTVISLSLDDLPTQTTNSPHDSSLKNALIFGIQMGEQLPGEIDILAIEINPSFEFSETLSPLVSASIPKIKTLAFEWLNL